MLALASRIASSVDYEGAKKKRGANSSLQSVGPGG